MAEIDAALKRVAGNITSADNSIQITQSAVLRGCVYEPQLMPVCTRVEEEYGFAQIKVLSFADLYAGKIMAALDRQQPRDLFDVHLLLEHEGITDELRTALIVYLIIEGDGV